MLDQHMPALGSFDCRINAACAYVDFLRRCNLTRYSVMRRLKCPILDEQKLLLDLSHEARICKDIQLPAASTATEPGEHSGWRLFEGALEAVTSDTSCPQA
eukprot:3873418-Pyramimonas_sp.AAC.1